MTREERRKRRKQVRAEFAGGSTVIELVAKHGLSDSSVYKACRGLVKLRTKKPLIVKTVNYAVLADIINDNGSIPEIAARQGASRQRVRQIYQGLIDAGARIKLSKLRPRKLFYTNEA